MIEAVGKGIQSNTLSKVSAFKNFRVCLDLDLEEKKRKERKGKKFLSLVWIEGKKERKQQNTMLRLS